MHNHQLNPRVKITRHVLYIRASIRLYIWLDLDSLLSFSAQRWLVPPILHAHLSVLLFFFFTNLEHLEGLLYILLFDLLNNLTLHAYIDCFFFVPVIEIEGVQWGTRFTLVISLSLSYFHPDLLSSEQLAASLHFSCGIAHFDQTRPCIQVITLHAVEWFILEIHTNTKSDYRIWIQNLCQIP